MIKLLVVDDSALMRRLMSRLFAAEGDFEVVAARSGAEALEQVTPFEPDVVTLDVNMPDMDGLACLDRIMLLRPCPVVMVSSLTAAGADVTLRALEAGAVDFVLKPDGSPSLAMDRLGPILVETVRAAAKAKVRRTLRLAERVRLQAGGAAGLEQRPPIHRAARALAPGPVPAEAAGRPPDGVILIGTSTGGPPALDEVLTRLPADLPWAVVVAQHMPASFTNHLARRLDRLCPATVVEVSRPMPLVAGHVFIGMGDADVLVGSRPAGPVVLPAPSAPEFRWHPSVDRLVASAMQHFEPRRIVGVLMTGMGDDGAAAMTRLRAAGGHTVAEAEETAVVWGMPGALVRAGGADVVAPLDRIAAAILDALP